MTSSTTAAPARVSRRRAETRDRLLQAAIGAFAAQGVAGASVEEICEGAGFTRGAFYSNFASKDELVLAVLKLQASAQLTQAREAIATARDHAGVGDDPDARVARTVELFVASQHVDRTWLLAAQELRLYAARQPEVARELIAFEAELTAELSELLRDALAWADREFTVPVEEALTLLIAVWESGSMRALIRTDHGSEPRPPHEPLVTLLSAITRATS